MDVLGWFSSFVFPVVAWMAGLALGLGLLGWLMPCNPGMYWWKDLRAAATDLLYWLLTPLVQFAGRVVLLVVAANVVLAAGGEHGWLLPLRDLPLWIQLPAVLLIQDVMMYWTHRGLHGRWLWRFHDTHHSPKVLDWMSAGRVHLVNGLLEYTVADVAVLILGFSPDVFVILVPFSIVYSGMVHANLRWTFGPLRFVLASPVFHRWHHTTQEEGLDTNFAPTFAFLDVAFGTFHMPAGRLPEKYGNGDAEYPAGFWAQLVYPLTRRSVQAAPVAEAPKRRQHAA
jgi:sterol desaturase/sphingolipid hydroxylase (fatty acid hydroxylase superfamily)